MKDNISHNTARLILGEKVETFRDRKAIFSYLCLKNREVLGLKLCLTLKIYRGIKQLYNHKV